MGFKEANDNPETKTERSAESKKANDKWLFSQGVKPGKYSWGSIDSMANESLDISAIIINYD